MCDRCRDLEVENHRLREKLQRQRRALREYEGVTRQQWDQINDLKNSIKVNDAQRRFHTH